MSESEEIAAETAPPPSRWPASVGTLGIILGILVFIDNLDDLLLPIIWPEDQWRKLLAPEVADLVARSLPSPAWLAITSLSWMALAILLIVGSLRIRRRQLSGVGLCRRWAWLAIAMLGVEAVRSVRWFAQNLEELQRLAPGQWQGLTVFVTTTVMLVMLSYPIFLLVWFSRPRIRQDYLAWSG